MSTTSTFPSVDRSRVRRIATRNGYSLRKLRTGSGYDLIDNQTRALVLGDHHGIGVGEELDTIEAWLRT